MKATLQDGTTLEGTSEEIKTVIDALTVRDVIDRTSMRRTEKVSINGVGFDAILPEKRKRGTKGRAEPSYEFG